MSTASGRSQVRSEVRSDGRAARQALAGEQRAAATDSLVGHLKHLDAVAQARSVGVFVAHDGEPDLSALVHWLWRRGADAALPVLRDDPSDYSMRFVPWRESDALTAGRYGIPVPPDREPVEPNVLLVSLVGFDPAGNRMGRGGGFFDRYLASTAATTVGVGFEVQRFDSIPTEPHDQRLPTIVTDHGVRYLNGPNSDEFRGIRPSIGKDGRPCA